MGADPDTVTFMGISGGGYETAIMHTTYSETIKGAAQVVAGPYSF